jgi:hypothetical protein
VSKLESRLADTENALCQLASQYYAGVSPDQNEKLKPCSGRLSSDASKSDRMKEWETMPLKTIRDVEKWWRENAAHHDGTVNLEGAKAPDRPLQFADSSLTMSNYDSILGSSRAQEHRTPNQMQPSATTCSIHRDRREGEDEWTPVDQMDSARATWPYENTGFAAHPGSESNSKAKQLAAQKSFLYF